MNRKNTLLLALCIFSLTSCSVVSIPRTSNFSLESCQPGLTRTDIVTKFGKPFKQSFFYDASQALIEILQYKESIYNTNRWHELNTTLQFKNERLISFEQAEEKPVYYDSIPFHSSRTR